MKQKTYKNYFNKISGTSVSQIDNLHKLTNKFLIKTI